jgi:hypothetical protein
VWAETGQVKMGLGKIIDWAIGFILFYYLFSAGLGRVWGQWFFLGIGIQNKRELG